MLPPRDNVPTRHFPVVTVSLILANALVWWWQLTGTPIEEDVYRYGYYPCTVSGPCTTDPGVPAGELSWWAGAFTSMFMHGDIIHLGGNMLFLFVFGDNELARSFWRKLGFGKREWDVLQCPTQKQHASVACDAASGTESEKPLKLRPERHLIRPLNPPSRAIYIHTTVTAARYRV